MKAIVITIAAALLLALPAVSQHSDQHGDQHKGQHSAEQNAQHGGGANGAQQTSGANSAQQTNTAATAQGGSTNPGRQRGRRSAVAPPLNAIPCGELTLPSSSSPAPTLPSLMNAPLQSIPEIQSNNGVLRGTIYTVSEQQRFAALGGTPPNRSIYCYPQWVRAFRVSPPASWNPPASELFNPQPGPTLRARLGDMVELSLMNVIDPKKFVRAQTDGCDQTSAYPAQTGDRYPDCFAGSVITNIHYHGSHTNPNATGDNVFLQIQPVPRDQQTNVPKFTFQDVYPAFQEFFRQCEQQLMANPGPKEWPKRWGDLPTSVQTVLGNALKNHAEQWWAADQKQIEQGNFPQFYVGAFPYCFKLPNYAAATPVSTTSPAVRTPHTHGAGTAEVEEAKAPARPLIMGQSPGTHWYHAHKHGSTTINVLNGMTGVFIVEGPYDDELNAHYGANWTRSLPPLVINQLGSIPALMAGTFLGPGPILSVNGQLQPVITMPGNSVQLWRFANTSSRAGVYFAAPPRGLQWKQLAQDGVQFNDANYNAPENRNGPVLLFPGNRGDLLVKAPPYVEGGNNTYKVEVYNTVDASDRVPARPSVAPMHLLTVQVTKDVVPAQDFLPRAPSFPPFLNDIADHEVTGTQTLTFASTASNGTPVPASQHTIDGKLFNGEVGVTVLLNRVEEWKIVNKTFPPSTSNQISHPFHIHINPFQVSELFDPNAVLSHTLGKGTVTLDGAGNVTGHGTSFTKDFRVGDWIWFHAGALLPLPLAPAPAAIMTIDGDDRMTVNIVNGLDAAAYKNARYEIAIPLYTIDAANRRPGQCVLDPQKESTWKPCGPTVPATNRIWWDVFPIPSGNTFYAKPPKSARGNGKKGTQDGGKNKDEPRYIKQDIPGYFKMRSRFVDYAGYYVLHCHILAHEDRGMMTVVSVVPLQSPFSHH